MTAFVCNDCGYRFNAERKSSCPYCDGSRVDKEKTAEELVNEVGVE